LVKSLDSCCWDFSLVQPGFFAAFILFFMPIADEPALNDVSELDRRDFLGLLALALLVIIILPAPQSYHPTVAD